MQSTSAPDAPGTAIWLAKYASYSSSTKRVCSEKGKMSENECACMTVKKKKACDRQHEGRKAEECNS